MAISPEKFVAARKASNMTIADAANRANLSPQGYINREKKPDQFRLCELDGLHGGMTETGRQILEEAVSDIFLSQ